MPSTLMYCEALYFLLLFVIHNVSALGISFTSPAAGATLSSGAITVQWQDGGGSPDMGDLVSGTLVLVVGGNNPGSDAQTLQTIGPANSSIAAGTLTGTISANLAQSIQNGFYLMMTSNTSDGSTVINYSNRFTLVAMTGTTPSNILQGATAEAGSDSNVPTAYVIEKASPSSSLSATPSSTATNTNPTSASTSTSTPPVIVPAGNHKGNGGLAEATLAGLIVGAILACIGLISLVIWAVFFYKRAKRRKAERDSEDEIRKSIFGNTFGNKAELPARRSGIAMRELSPQQEPVEMPGEEKLYEAPGEELVFELEGDIALWEAGSGRRSQAWDPTAHH